MSQGPSLLECPVCGGAIASTAASCPHCGHRPKGLRASIKIDASTVALGIGALLIAVGSFLPWTWTTSSRVPSLTLFTVSHSGIDVGDGMVTLGIGVLLGALALANFSRDGVLRGFRLLSLLGGLGAVAIATIRASDVGWRASEYISWPWGTPVPLYSCKISGACPNGVGGGYVPGQFTVIGSDGVYHPWMGPGIFIVGIGGAVVIVVALCGPVLRRLRPPETPGPA